MSLKKSQIKKTQKKTKRKKKEEHKKQKIKKSSSLRSKIAPKKYESIKVPKRNQDIISGFFDNYDEITNIFQIAEDTYSVCFEYRDIAFSKANIDEQEGIMMKWLDYLHSFNDNCHIQVTNAGTPIATKDYKNRFVYNEEQSPNVRNAKEFNSLIEKTLSSKSETLEAKRYVTISQKATSLEEATEYFENIETKTETKFKELKSSIRRLTCDERFDILYNTLHVSKSKDDGIDSFIKKSKEEKIPIKDLIAPKAKVNLKESDYIEIEGKRFIRCMYVARYSSSVTPRFYNRLTTMSDVNLITTLNIQPTKPVHIMKRIGKKITGMKSERLVKIKRALKNGYPYEAVIDETLEEKLKDARQLKFDLQKNNQKVFNNNLIMVVIADNFEELELHCRAIKDLGGEHLLDVQTLKWQQLEGLENALPFGKNTLEYQRSLTSEATAINVPFNSKDLLHEQGLFFGRNLISKNAVFVNRKLLQNGNGCVLATSGAGKSFNVKLTGQQVRLRYPEDDIIYIDLQGEYGLAVRDENGQIIPIDVTSDTHLNIFDLDLNYDEKNPLKAKTEYVTAVVESMVNRKTGLDGIEQSIIDRCCKLIYKEYQESGYQDKSKVPNLKDFHQLLNEQSEVEAKKLALTLERFVEGSLDMFAHDTNIDIKNQVVSFDLSRLPESMQTTGYLVVLDFIKNKLAQNKAKGTNTWIMIDEFHILLANQFSAEYIAKIYKTGRKLGALPLIITQNIQDVLENEHGRKILGNSEFAVILKQKNTDLEGISSVFNISKEEESYVLDSPSGQMLLIYGNDVIPCSLKVPEEYHLYELNNTDAMAIAR